MSAGDEEMVPCPGCGKPVPYTGQDEQTLHWFSGHGFSCPAPPAEEPTAEESYHDSDGKPISLCALVRKESGWAAARIRWYRKLIDELGTVLECGPEDIGGNVVGLMARVEELEEDVAALAGVGPLAKTAGEGCVPGNCSYRPNARGDRS